MTEPDALLDFIEPVWLIGCSRCANEGHSHAMGSVEACADFREQGWTCLYPRTYCPACSRETDQ